MTNYRKIKEHLTLLKQYEVVLFGSVVKKEATTRSDIDVAVISRLHDKKQNMELWYTLLGKVPDGYDLKVFELLPLPLQIEIANRYRAVYGNSIQISEYFYHFRKLWKDVERRYRQNQFGSIRERKEALRAASMII